MPYWRSEKEKHSTRVKILIKYTKLLFIISNVYDFFSIFLAGYSKSRKMFLRFFCRIKVLFLLQNSHLETHFLFFFRSLNFEDLNGKNKKTVKA